MSELSKRIITALVLVALVWGWYFHTSTQGFAAGLCILGMLVCGELLLLMHLRPVMAYLALTGAFWLGFYFWPQAASILLLFTGWLALFVLKSRSGEQSFAAFAAAAWMTGWLFAFVWVLADTHGSAEGRGLIIGVCLAVWAADIAAYFTGRRWGRRKLCPAISPGKSVEGLIGALIFGVPVAVFCWTSWHVLSPVQAALLGLVAVMTGVLGDLSESLLKRLVGAKDSGRLLPGHGGLLDRLDAIIMAVPVTWALWGML